MDNIKKELSMINSPLLQKATVKILEKSYVGKRVNIKKINSKFGAVQKYYKPICKLFYDEQTLSVIPTLHSG